MLTIDKFHMRSEVLACSIHSFCHMQGHRNVPLQPRVTNLLFSMSSFAFGHTVNKVVMVKFSSVIICTVFSESSVILVLEKVPIWYKRIIDHLIQNLRRA